MSQSTATPGLMDRAVYAVKEIGKGFTEPDDDWLMTLLARNPDDEVIALALAGVEHDDIPAAIETFMLRERAVEAVLVASGWQVIIKGDADLLFAPSGHPNRAEVLTVVGVAKDQGVTETRFFIDRHPDSPPTLSEADPVSDVSGRFVDAMVSGLNSEPMIGETP